MLGAQVLASVVINRKYGIEAVGIYALVLAISQIVITGISQPFSSLIRRDLVLLKKETAILYVKNVNYLRFLNLILILIITLILISFFSEKINNIKPFLILMLISKGFEMLNDTYFVTYQSLSKYKRYAILKTVYSLLMCFSIAFIYFNNVNIELLYYLQVIVGIAYFIFNYLLFEKLMPYERLKKGLNLFLSQDRKHLLLETWPMMVNSLVFQGSSKLNAIIIFHFISAKDLGIFSILVMFSNIFGGVGNSLGIVLISRFTILIQESVKQFKIFFKKSMLLFFGLGVVLFICYIFSLPLLVNIFKLKMPGLFKLNLVIGAAIPFLFATGCIGNIFFILKKQIVGVYISIIVLLFNVLLYSCFAFSFALEGTGYAYLITSAFQFFIILFWASKILKKR